MSITKLQSRLVQSIVNTRIYDFLKETPLIHAKGLSHLCSTKILLKREDLQPVFSFKVRGAYHKMTLLAPEKIANGVVAASSGNHAQGVALSASRLGIQSIIVMPTHTQQIKIAAVKGYGGNVILHGDSFDEAYIYAIKLAKEKQMHFFPPFDDEDIIAGNGTIAAEILRQHPKPIHAIFCAIGGGGLISGVAAYVKAWRPSIKVIGVEAEESASMTASLRAKRRVSLNKIGIFADAVAVKKPGKLTFNLVRHLVDDIITVDNDAICAAIKEIYDDTRTIVEPSGALSVAGIHRYLEQKNTPEEPLVAIACGSNMNFERLRFIAERADMGEKKEILLAVTIPEAPGSFNRFCKLLGKRNITEFNYRISDCTSEAHIFVGLSTQQPEERFTLVEKLCKNHLPTIDLTDDEMSKLHIRHMVGGRAKVKQERLYRFEFPERPGALKAFLQGLYKSFPHVNISLFHYRNHGSDIGRVLCGIQIPSADIQSCERFLQELGYPFFRETNNQVYRLFLSGE